MRAFAQKQNQPKQAPALNRNGKGSAATDSRQLHTILYLQRTIGNQAVQRLLNAKAEDRELRSGKTEDGGTVLDHFIVNSTRLQLQRDSSPAAEREEGKPAAASPAKTLQIEFAAFIPGSLGKLFKDHPQYTGLKNQAAFDAAVAAVAGTWLKEPGESKDRGAWYYSTDNREFGGGSHRVGFSGTVNVSGIGALIGKTTIFRHWCDPSHRVRAQHTGAFTPTGETGSVDGPHSKAAIPTNSEDPPVNGPNLSSLSTKGSAAYAFMPTLSPNIDYKVNLTIKKTAASMVEVSGEITRNKFPFYEILVNGTHIYKWSSPDKGPSLTNLNSSETDSITPKTF
jgi:hypothetical protein